jgi:hypothetical protein
MASDFNERARRLRNAVEPVAAGVYFAPEAHEAYEALGFDGSPVIADGVARAELKSYFTSRCACMGQVPGEVVAAAFGCFNPKVVVPAVTMGWQVACREAILDARERGAIEMLRRVLGDEPEGLARVTDLLRRAGGAAAWAGRAVFSGLRSLGFPGNSMGDLWRAADLVDDHWREARADLGPEAGVRDRMRDLWVWLAAYGALPEPDHAVDRLVATGRNWRRPHHAGCSRASRLKLQSA